MTDLVTFLARRISVSALGVLVILLPLIAFVMFFATARMPFPDAVSSYGAWLAGRFVQYWPLVAGAIVYGLVLRFVWDRYVSPKLSAYWRSMRVTQEADKPVDARDEAGSLAAKDFEPEKFFQRGSMFYGLNDLGEPIRIALDLFKKIHHAILGPTRYGKGVVLQAIYKQCIRAGFTVFYIDPKGDDYLPYLLQNEAELASRRFVYLDLNPGGKGTWHPFLGGDFRQRRTRIVRAYNLESAGTDADVYKAKERSLLDDALEATDGTIKSLSAYVAEKGNAGDRDLSTLRDSLREWARVDTFSQPSRRKGHSIEACLMNNAVVYVRGDLDDPVIKAATKAYISELVAEIKRLHPKRTSHVTVGVDELKFLACAEINSALAAIAGYDANLLLAAQSIANIEAPDDKRLDGKALAREFEVNTHIKLVYRAQDERTAEWAENLSGTQWLDIAQRENVKANVHGGEQWEGTRTIAKLEHAIISRNTLLNLPPRVGIVYMPDRNPSKIFTSPVKVDRSVASWETGPAGTEPAPEAAPAP
ncbi:type IV secretion system DNA-binding domain-containing protein [Paraburkholderia sp. SIMBA_049]